VTEQEESGLAIVEQMFEGWHALDPDAILSTFADGATMQSMMKVPYHGKTEIRAMLDGFFSGATRVEVEILSRIVNGKLVVFERRDHFTFKGKLGTLPVVGVFEIEDGLIRAWREYYDWAVFERQIA